MPATDIMLDLETLDTRTTGVILAIGAVAFGNHDPEWSAEDNATMELLGPVEKRIASLLAASQEQGQ